MNNRPSQDERHFRRGVVLGLTFAEVLLLLIFVLMLILAGRLITLRNDVKNERSLRAQAEHALEVFRPMLKRVGTPQDKFDITKEWVRLHDQVARAEAQLADSKPLIDLVEKRRRQTSGMTKQQAAAQLVQEAALGRRFGQLAAAMFPSGSLAQSADALEQAARLGKSLLSKSPGQTSLAGQLSTCSTNLNTCKAQNSNLSARLGGVLPPCWVDSAGKQQYMFDTHLKEDGIWVTPNQIEGRERDAAALTINNFSYDRPMSQLAFVQAGLPLLKYSEKNNCRFYVRVFDDTGAQSKIRYKELLKGVEGIFYKLQMQ